MNKNDIIGKKFNKLTVLTFNNKKYVQYKNRKRAYYFYKCKCDCGKNIIVNRDNLISNHTKSCGCLNIECITKRNNLEGKKIGNFIILKEFKSNKNNHYLCLCKCICGKEKIIEKQSITTGKTKSCGCRTGISNRKNLSGKRFGRLKVLYIDHTVKTNNKHGYIDFYKCKCDCGNEMIVNGRTLPYHKRKCHCIEKIKYGDYHVVIRKLFNIYQRGSKKRKLNFHLTLDQFYNIISQNCYYCGCKPNQIIINSANKKKNKIKYIYNGIDRINNNLGYTIKNSVSCCKKCNFMKSTFSKIDFIKHINLIYKNIHFIEKNNYEL
jgi:hypothetical protein